MNDGLHDLLYAPTRMQWSFDQLVSALQEARARDKVSPVIWVTPPFLYDSQLTKHRADSKTFRNATVAAMVARQLQALSAIDGVYFYNTFRGGLHGRGASGSGSGSSSSSSSSGFLGKTAAKDGVHDMARARLEAEGFVRSAHWLNRDEQLWGHHPVTPGQIMCFLAYLAVVCVFVLGELALCSFVVEVDSGVFFFVKIFLKNYFFWKYLFFIFYF